MPFANISWRMQLIIYTCCIFFTSASYTACIPFLPVYLLELGAPEDSIELWSAMVFSSCFFIAAVMAPIWGKISDNKGKKSMALRSSILLCVTYTCGGLVTAPIQLLFVRIFQGFANGYLPVILSMVSAQSPKEKLGTSLSFIQSAQLVGTVSGPLLGGVLAQFFGYRASFLIAGCALALVSFVTFLTPDHSKKVDATAPKTTIIQDLTYCVVTPSVREILTLFFCFNMVMMAIQPLLSLFVAELTGGYENVAFYAGIACSIPPFVGALTAPIWGMFGQRKGYYRAMALALLGSGIFLGLQGFSNSYLSLLVLSGVMGLFIVGVMPSLNASITLATPADFKGRAFGAMTLFGQLGCMVGPLMSAVISHNFAIRYQFIISGSMLFLMSLFVAKRFFAMRRELQHSITAKGNLATAINVAKFKEAIESEQNLAFAKAAVAGMSAFDQEKPQSTPEKDQPETVTAPEQQQASTAQDQLQEQIDSQKSLDANEQTATKESTPHTTTNQSQPNTHKD